MFERFTDRARRVLVLAQEEARLLHHPFLGTEHILLGLIREDEGIAAKALTALDISLDAARREVVAILGTDLSSGGMKGDPPFTPRAKKVMELALREALRLGHNYIGTEHLLLGVVREGEGVGAQALINLGADLAEVRNQVVQLLSGYPASGATPLGPGTSAMPSIPAAPGRLVACSFCGRRPPESGRLVQGRGAFICERCVGEWSEQLLGSGEDEETPGPPATLYEPEDEGGPEGSGGPSG